MKPSNPRPSVTTARSLRLGFLALTDAAPLVAAQELGFFKRHGLRVVLQREVGWATIREKIIYGELDGATAPAPMLWSAHLGLGCAPSPMLTALVFNLHGNAITLSNALRAEGVHDLASLRTIAKARRGERRLTFGVVFPYSSHHLLLRQWLLSAGIQPDTDVRIAVVPPAQMFRNLEAGTIDGFMAGEPWNSFAVQAGAGWCPTWSAALSPGHIEKVLMVSERFAENRATEHLALVGALAEACAWCDDPQNREEIALILSGAPYLNVRAASIMPALTGRFDCGNGRVENVPDFLVFHRGGVNVPTASQAALLQSELHGAGLLPAGVDSDLPRRLFREDLYRSALHTYTTHEPVTTSDLRGLAI
jgi:ABC-type nitrate/sulfonate/bicarbonate transport system substrate-binding protein